MNMSEDIRNLLMSAASENTIATANLTNANTLRQIEKGMGISPDQFQGSQVRLVGVLVDDSGSIAMADNIDLVIEGHNTILDALGATKQKNSILIACWYLSDEMLYPFSHLSQAVRMTRANYDPNCNTPLYDRSVVALGTVVAKAQEFENAGIAASSWTLLLSDGADYGSRRYDAGNVRDMVRSLNPEQHVVMAMGLSDGHTDFAAVFESMGIQKSRILVANANNPSEIRRAFQMASQSAVGMNAAANIGGLGA